MNAQSVNPKIHIPANFRGDSYAEHRFSRIGLRGRTIASGCFGGKKHSKSPIKLPYITILSGHFGL